MHRRSPVPPLRSGRTIQQPASPRASSTSRSPCPTTTRSPIAGRPRVASHHLPGPVRQLAEEEALPPPAGRLAMAHQPGRHDARVVPDQDVAGIEQVRQVGEDPMLPASPADDRPPSAAIGPAARPDAGRSGRRGGRSRGTSVAGQRGWVEPRFIAARPPEGGAIARAFDARRRHPPHSVTSRPAPRPGPGA